MDTDSIIRVAVSFGATRIGFLATIDRRHRLDHSFTMTEPSTTAPVSSSTHSSQLTAQQQKVEMIADEDPLLISQSLTYVTDDGSVLHSFQSAPYSFGASRS